MGTPYCQPSDVIDICSWPTFASLSSTQQTRLINAASTRVDSHCRRPFGFSQQVVTETIDGKNQPSIYLALRPVVQILGVTINSYSLDNTLGNAWTVNPNSGRLVRSDGLDWPRFGAFFPAGLQNVAVQYWGGYNPVPDEIVTATAWICRWLQDQGKLSGLFAEEAIGDYSYKLRDKIISQTLPEHIAALLAAYVQEDAFV